MLKKSLSVIVSFLLIFAFVQSIPEYVNADTIEKASNANYVYNNYEFNGHEYLLIDEGMVWEDAQAYCESLGGYLACITSTEEQLFINGLLETGSRNSYWLGGYYESKHWLWISGEEFSYTNWAPYMPDNRTGKEFCLMAYRVCNPRVPKENGIGEWNDLKSDCTCNSESFFGRENFGFICEWDYTGVGYTVLGESFLHNLQFYSTYWDSTQYSPELAHLMMTMSNAAYDPVKVGNGYIDLGLSNYEPYNYFNYGSVYGTENVCYSLASSVDDGTIIIMVALRGSGRILDIKQGTLDWLGNFDTESAVQINYSPHKNFNSAARHVYDGINAYLDLYYSTTIENAKNIKFFITGHSRGGAVANLLEYKLESVVGKSNLYGYNFAVPDTAKISNQTNVEGFDNIFNISNLQDPVSYLPGNIADMMTSLTQVFASGRIDNKWRKWGRSIWFSDSEGAIDGSAHDPDRYVDFMRNRNSFGTYTDNPKFHLAPVLARWGPFIKVKYKLFATYCPVNVEVVDENGNVIASVIDGVVDYRDSHFGEVIVTTVDDHKMFAVPSDKNYTLRIVGSNNGTLDYYVAETDIISEETTPLKSFEGVALETGKEMVGKAVNVIDSDEQMIHEDKLITVGDEPVEIMSDGKEVPYTYSYILGDADDSGEVEAIDATWLQRYIASFATPYDIDTLMHGDVDYDREADITDVTMIQRYLAQFSTPYLIGADVV